MTDRLFKTVAEYDRFMDERAKRISSRSPETPNPAQTDRVRAKQAKGRVVRPATKKRVRQPVTSEHEEQVLVVQWAEMHTYLYPQLGFLFAIPNGGNRGMAEAKRFKAEGVRSGVPDLALPVPAGRFHALFIEMKSAKGRASTSQLDWIANLLRAGNAACVCYGADAAISVLRWYVMGATDGDCLVMMPDVRKIESVIGG